MRRVRTRRRRRNPSEPSSTERWAVSYADFITLLFAFFTTLYAMSRTDQSALAVVAEALRTAFAHEDPPISTRPVGECPEPAEPTDEREDTDAPEPEGRRAWTEAERLARLRLQDRIAHLVRQPALAGRVMISPDPRGVRLTLGAAAFFEPGDSRLRAGTGEAMAVLGDALARHDGEIVVEGHTDDTPVRGGPFRSNWELSTARATEVVAMFVDRSAVPPTRLSAAGYAEHRPIADNRTATGRANNRRVDIVVIPADPLDGDRP